jgi:acetoacetyl-CoA reductase
MDRRVAIVTGGTGGIGTAISKRLASAYQVVACYYKGGDHQKAKQWQDEMRLSGFDVDIIYADIAHFSDCSKMAELVAERYGQIDVLVNNAGVTQDSRFVKMTPEQWHQVIDSNLNSIFNVTKNVLPFMIQNKFGRIINISSINGRKGQFGQCNYAATKAALFGFTKSLALEVASQGITVNTISPGYIATSMLSSVKPEVMDKIVSAIPLGRLGSPSEVASAVAFLAADESAFITGANLDINGGQYM